MFKKRNKPVADPCPFWWGEFRCTREKHDDDVKHSLVWDGEDDQP